jgi:membrane protease YdiL (CAAX protease family)
MAAMANAYKPKIREWHNSITFLLIAGLLFLRLPFLAGITYLLKTSPNWLGSAFEISTYLLTAILIWWERDRLLDFHVDGLALTIILFFKPIETIIRAFWGWDKSGLAFPNPLGLLFWAIAIGVLVGAVELALLGYPMSFQVDESCRQLRPELVPILVQAIPGFIYQLGYAAVTEEPLFRGFLWGYLRKVGWKEVWIWLFQAALFCLGHIYYLDRAPISFWIIVPTGALVMGLVAWRSRSIAASMAAHGCGNALGYTMGCMIAFYRQ